MVENMEDPQNILQVKRLLTQGGAFSRQEYMEQVMDVLTQYIFSAVEY